MTDDDNNNDDDDVKGHLLSSQQSTIVAAKKKLSILCIVAYLRDAVFNNQPSDYRFEGYYMLPIDQFER